MTNTEIIALLREDPHAAFDIVRSACIAGPRKTWGSDPACSGRKPLHGGSPVAMVMEEGADLIGARFTTGRIYGYLPNGDRQKKLPDEPLTDFIQRIERIWCDTGWIFADEKPPQTGRRSTDL